MRHCVHLFKCEPVAECALAPIVLYLVLDFVVEHTLGRRVILLRRLARRLCRGVPFPRLVQQHADPNDFIIKIIVRILRCCLQYLNSHGVQTSATLRVALGSGYAGRDTSRNSHRPAGQASLSDTNL